MSSALSLEVELPPSDSIVGAELLKKSSDDDDATSEGMGFGLFSWRPHCLQIFAKPFCFLIILNTYCLVEGIIVSGLTNVVLSSLETRYEFSSTQLGMMTSTFDITVLVTVIFISYFGGTRHKPKWLGVGIFIQGIGALLFASPHFIAGDYDVGKNANLSFEACSDENDFSPDCNTRSSNIYFIFVLANILIGIGASPLFTIGVSYIDDIVHPRRAPIWLGIFYALAVIGPALGFGIGGGFLRVYVDPSRETTLDESDPGWVGAWWIGFIICGAISILISILFFLFPEKYSDTDLIKQERIKQISLQLSRQATEEDLVYRVKLKDLPRHVLKLVARMPFLFITLAYSTQIFVISGLVVFSPKYIEAQFGINASSSGLLVGAITIPSAGLGIMIGAFLVFFLKPATKRLALYYAIINVASVLFLAGFFLRCSTHDIAGVTVSYRNSTSGGLGLTDSCNSDCNCKSSVFEPVCGSDDITYFSPCRAGCDKDDRISKDDPVFENCTCITGQSTAETEYCDSGCKALVPYLLTIALGLIMNLSGQIPNVVVTLRCIADEHRSLALGLQSVFFRVLGSIPAPIIVGALFDSSCLYWQEECGDRGNCWVYDNDDLSLRIFGVMLGVRLLSCVFAVCTWVFFDVTLCSSRDQVVEFENSKENGIAMVKSQSE